MSSACSNMCSFFFWYETPKVVHIRSKKVGILGRFIQLCIVAYIVGYVLVYQKGYQEKGTVQSAVVTKVKGTTFTRNSRSNDYDPAIYDRVWDVSDIVVPASENEALFVTTNMVITPNQTRRTCDEDPEVDGAVCDPKSNTCQKGIPFLLGNGVATGKCIPSTHNSSISVCEIEAWCPVEKDRFPLGPKKALLDSTSNFTLLIKNFIEFPYFGKDFRRRNIPEDANKTYLQNCLYDPENNPLCPVFRLGDIAKFAGEDYSQLAIKGGVILIIIEWNCNLDLDFLTHCKPKYSFRRVDDPQTKISPGWNFRYSSYHEENRRTLVKAYGIRFVIEVRGKAGKFNIIPTLLNIASGLSLLGLTTIVCDFIILHLMSRAPYYQDVKYHKVNEDSADNERSPVSRQTGSYQSFGTPEERD